MNFIKKKKIQIFANGSSISTNFFFKQLNKTKFYNKDHTTFSFYKKDSDSSNNSKNFVSFKTKYLKF